MTQSLTNLNPGVLLKRTAGLIRGNLEIFLLIALLWTILSAIVFMPIRGDLQEIVSLAEQVEQSGQASTDEQRELAERIVPLLDDLLLIAVVTLLFSSAAYLVWARSIGLGRTQALGAGTVRRLGLVLWRQLALIGYILLTVIAVSIAGLILQAVTGMLGGGQGLVMVVTNLLTIALILPLFVAFAMSVAATALDNGNGILKSLQMLKGRYFGPVLASIAIMVVMFFILLALGAVIGVTTGSEALSTPSLLVQNAFNSMGLMALVALGHAINEQLAGAATGSDSELTG